ncbi:unnamed protein product, partial [Oppiella nova]
YPAQNGKTGKGDYFDIDAKTFAEWGIDSFKFDGCNEDPKNMDELYPKMGESLNKTGRHMVFICEWPLYQLHGKIKPNYTSIANTCHVYRNHGDVGDSWASISSIIQFYGDNNEEFIKYNGPGHWNDPDMVMVGDFGLSYEQSRTHMAMWAMFSAPLYMSNDLRDLKPEDKQILQNKEIIAVNQDKHGIMAKRVFIDDKFLFVQTQFVHLGFHLLFTSIRQQIYLLSMSEKISTLIPGAKDVSEYTVEDLFKDEVFKDMKGSNLELKVATGGGCRMVKLVPKK